MNLIKKYLITKKLVKKSKKDLDQMYLDQEDKAKALKERLDKHDK